MNNTVLNKNMEKEIKILVCTHKEFNMPNDSIYLPIQVGKAETNLDLGILSDCEEMGGTYDNISELNPIYCEMTAMYWAWKNIRRKYPEIRYIGLCHYRRYFNPQKNIGSNLIMGTRKIAKTMLNIATGKRINFEFIEKVKFIKNVYDNQFKKSTLKLRGMINACDILTTYPIRIINSNVETFFSVIGRDYLRLLKDIVAQDYTEYYKSMIKVLNGTKLCAANMLVLKVEYLDEYCSFVFGVLDKHIQETKNEGICFDPINEKIYSRVSGYLAEILTGTYIEKKKKEAHIMYTGKFFIDNK